MCLRFCKVVVILGKGKGCVMPKIVKGNFEWDSEKEQINIKKHGFSFEEVLPAFDDPCFIEIYDDNHSTWLEHRYLGIGTISGLVIVTTVFTERKRTRLISARHATEEEEVLYYEQQNNFNA